MNKFLGQWAAPRFVLMLIGFVLILNSFLFVVRTADPLLVQDGWYYLDVFLSKAIHGTLTLSDFFTRRGGYDHSQPFYKLIYLLELKYFRLDFLPQAVAGFIAAIGIALVCFLAMIRGLVDKNGRFRTWIGFVVVLACVTSLNSTEIWTWPDVTMQYLCFFFVALFFYTAVTVRSRHDLYKLAVATIIITFVASDVAIIAVAAVVVVIFIEGYGRWRENVHRTGVLLVTFVLAELLLAWLTPVVGGSSTNQGIGALVGKWNELWKWVVLPLAGSVVSAQNLASYFPNHMMRMQLSLAVALMLSHVVFWFAYFRSEKVAARSFAACLMLLFYGLVAGIVVGRVGYFGSEYLNSPRYILYYQFNLIALVIMWATWAHSARRIVSYAQLACVSAMLALLIVQVPLSEIAWRSAPYHRLAYNKIVSQIEAIRKDPAVTPPDCAPELPLCSMDSAHRKQAIDLIESAKLNLYSPEFRAMHGFVQLVENDR